MKNEYDERQLQIRGQVFFHGFVFTVLLLLANIGLQDMHIVWANGSGQNLIILGAIVMFVSVEALVRGAYFGLLRNRWLTIIVFGLCSVLLILLNADEFIKGTALFENGGLTDNGVYVISSAMFVLITVTGIVKEIIERRKQKM